MISTSWGRHATCSTPSHVELCRGGDDRGAGGDGRDPDWFDQSQNVSEKLGGKFSWSRGDLFGLRLRATLGLDIARDTTSQELVRAGMDWVPETTYESVSPFVQMEWWVADSVMLTGGLRHERGKLQVDDYITIPDQRLTPGRRRSPSP